MRFFDKSGSLTHFWEENSPIFVRVVNKDVPATVRFVRENLLRFFRILNWKIFVVHDELQSISGERKYKVAKFKKAFTEILEGGSVQVLVEKCNTDRARSRTRLCNTFIRTCLCNTFIKTCLCNTFENKCDSHVPANPAVHKEETISATICVDQIALKGAQHAMDPDSI